jgi:hypothetical protein
VGKGQLLISDFGFEISDLKAGEIAGNYEIENPKSAILIL